MYAIYIYIETNVSLYDVVIISRVRICEEPPYRPRVVEDEGETPEKIVALMRYCWQEPHETRPDMHTVIKMLIEINGKR